MTGIVIVGAGQAGASLAAKIRALGYDGPVTLIGEEPAPPYQRPPLSKGYLLREMGLERLYLRAPSFWKENEISLKLASPVTSIDRSTRMVRVGDEPIPYDKLALTTGSRPRRIPPTAGGSLKGVYTIRTLADIDAMGTEFQSGRKLLIVGGGYLGLEAAAVGVKLGLELTLIEMAPRILQRVAAPPTSDYFRSLHSNHGVKIFENMGLDRLTGRGHVSGAVLSNGMNLPIDFVIVAIGVTPRAGLAEEAGLAIENGIRTDGQGRTSDPSIWSAGECASFPYDGRRIRLESVGNAIDHAELVAGNMLGASENYRAKPWFWSDQYDVKLQIAGLNTGYDRIVERKGDHEQSQSIWYYKGGRLLALDAMNDPRAYMVGKRIIEAGQTVAPEHVLDPSKDVKTLLSGATKVSQASAA
ncbi:FAD-dependent oxidoreductase [Mesorhizobium sp. VK25A]|uniref:FAD-dependent oxidoreductase n=1 Tax=Mesorhizobium vachelliae TaxID=3072309 RepID=A0ABU5AEP2_9HYPH|nr:MULTISPECIES: FAD-dependent oxidoreductase [unclassified Mesorhizobium]MDX8535738.1 FAD-dependent oxidoreductase [Mesorhizobium sp. VK25D]MDX8548481.1 FAD-dependent oxidoreductase [Mesorhizobium sp. VK25A]